jgi:hypothetical protein
MREVFRDTAHDRSPRRTPAAGNRVLLKRLRRRVGYIRIERRKVLSHHRDQSRMSVSRQHQRWRLRLRLVVHLWRQVR